MKLVPLLIMLIPVLILVIVGWAIKYRKAYWLISGYNTMSTEKKKNVDAESLGNFMGNVCFVMAGIIFAALVLGMLGYGMAFGIIFSLIIPLSIYTVIHSQKYDANTRDSKGKMKTSVKIIVGSIVAFLLIVCIGVAILLLKSSQTAQYTINNGILNISGMYGQEVQINSVSKIELKDTMPEIIFKTNGSALGTKYKGYFNLEGIKGAKLFVDASKPPFIFIESSTGAVIILNCDDANETKRIFDELYKEWEN